MVSVDAKHHVYLPAVAVFTLLMDDDVPSTNSTAVGRLQGGKNNVKGYGRYSQLNVEWKARQG